MIIFKLQWKKKRIKERPKNYTKGVFVTENSHLTFNKVS